MEATIVTLTILGDLATELENMRRREQCSLDELVTEAVELYLAFGDDLRRVQALHNAQ
jgi:hypothetical protein